MKNKGNPEDWPVEDVDEQPFEPTEDEQPEAADRSEFRKHDDKLRDKQADQT
jgi:hypothetical protein